MEKAYSVRSSVKRKTARGTQYDSQVMHAACSFTATLEDGTKLVEVFMPRDILIDSALAADRCTGCRNFTIAHEAAHQILADLFPNDYGKAVKCRGHIAYRERNGKASWEEWQADAPSG